MAIMAGALIDVADFADTGWVDVTDFESGTTNESGHEVQVRRIGVIVFLRGRMSRTSSTGTQTWCTIPTGFEPDRVAEIAQRAQEGSSSFPDRVFVTAGGEIQTQGTPAGTGLLWINSEWILAE